MIPYKRIKKLRKHHLTHLGLILMTLGVLLGGVTVLWVSSQPLPDFESFEEIKVEESTKIYDKTGEVLLFDVHKDIKRTVVPLDEISRHVKNATIAIEDSEFYNHKGVRPTAILRAFFANILSLDPTGQGGSTITQQVIKNTLLSTEQKYTRKIKEAVLALKLEQTISKDEILELYLNEAPYGGSIYGVEEASLAFFGKKSSNVTLAEAAYLAALPQAPTFYSPYGENTDRLEARKNLVLKRMVQLGFITEEEKQAAQEEEIIFSSRDEQNIKAPHFVIYVRNYLEDKYGEDVIETQGLRVTTTLDWKLQQEGEQILKEYGASNAENFNAHNAALVAIEPQTGNILTMVGSRDWFGESYPENCVSGVDCKVDPKVNIATIKPGRQPGSAFKPFVYATSFKEGYTPETVLFDLRTQFSSLCDAYGNPNPGVSPDTCYTPENYDFTFRGPVTIREALAQSINVPAVKTLYLSGLQNSLNTAEDLGITSLDDINRYGLTLVLGGGEVSLLELTSAYGVFANDGVRAPHNSILKIEDKYGNVLEEYRPTKREVLDENIARQITDILSDNQARTPAFGANSPLYFPGYDVAAKTGTTNDYRDAWIVGYSPNIVVGAWAGNSDNSSMEKRVAGFIVAPFWNEFMQTALTERPKEVFTKPFETPSDIKPVLRGIWEGSRTYYTDAISGKLATEYTPEETKEEHILTQIHSILHWVDKNNPRGPIPENPEKDPQYLLWETKVRDWAAQKNIQEQDESIIPTQVDDVHTGDNKLSIIITNPTENRSYNTGERVSIQVTGSGPHPLSQVDYFINSTYLGTIRSNPFTLSFTPKDVETIQEENTITVRAYDSVRNKTETSVEFKVQNPI